MENKFYTQFIPHFTMVQQRSNIGISQGSVEVYQYLGGLNCPKENYILIHEASKLPVKEEYNKNGEFDNQLDILIMSPLKGFLEIEVKGGNLAFSSERGIWTLNDIVDQKYRNPYDQTQKHRNLFKKYFKENNKLDLSLESAVCFPNVEDPDSIDCDKKIKNKYNFTMYRRDLPNLWNIINEKWIGQPTDIEIIKIVWDELVGTKFPTIEVDQFLKFENETKKDIELSIEKNEDLLDKINNIDIGENNIVVDKKENRIKHKIPNNLYNNSPLKVFLEKLIDSYCSSREYQISLFGIKLTPGALSDPNFLLTALLVTSAEDWSHIVYKQKSFGGFQIYIESDDKSVLGYKVINLHPSNLFLLALSILNKLKVLTKDDVINLNPMIIQFKYWLQSREFDTLDIDGLNNSLALKEASESN
jgi:hypothetical protein